jgi:hypothetical protein
MSRYRSVRRAQEQQQQIEHQQESAPPVPAVPPMPAVPEMEPKNDAPVSRSMSRYHRRPTVSHATTPALPPIRSNTVVEHKKPSTPQQPASRYRAASSANATQHRPRTAKQREDGGGPPSSQSRSPRSPRADQSARELLQKERERQRLLKEKYDAEARAQREAKQAELDRIEKARREEEEAALQEARIEQERAEALRRLENDEKAERERGKRLRKAEAHKVLQQRDEEARIVERARLERKAKAEEERAARKTPASSPPVSPPRHDTNFGLFKRRKDELTPEAPAISSKAPQLDLHLDEPATIIPGGGGAVLGIDAPTSAVNAGDRVGLLKVQPKHLTDFHAACDRSVSQQAHSVTCDPNDDST